MPCLTVYDFYMRHSAAIGKISLARMLLATSNPDEAHLHENHFSSSTRKPSSIMTIIQ